MKQEFLTSFPSPTMAMIGVFIFLVVFVGVLFWVFRKGSKKKYDKVSQLPLGKDN